MWCCGFVGRGVKGLFVHPFCVCAIGFSICPVPMEEIPLPNLLQEWAGRSLTEDTAPLLAAFAWVQQRDAADPVEQERWQNVLSVCEHTGLPLQRPLELPAFDERDDSRSADALLGDGPISVQLQPPRESATLSTVASAPTLASQASLAPPPKPKKEQGTFGSSRDPRSEEALKRAIRYQLPGPGAYVPEAYKGKGAPSHSWGNEDRLKHLGFFVRPRNQYHALPKSFGPAPGFYASTSQDAPQGRAVRLGFMRSASELPAGLPPQRNRRAVADVREKNRLAREGPGPLAYDPLQAVEHASEFVTRRAGRWVAPSVAASKPGSPSKSGGSPRATPMACGADERRHQGAARGDLQRGARPAQRHADARAGGGRARPRAAAAPPPRRRRREAAPCRRAAAARRRPPPRLAAMRAANASLSRMSDLFKGFDRVGRPRLAREFRDALGRSSSPNEAELNELFDAIDTDRSGEVDFKGSSAIARRRAAAAARRVAGALARPPRRRQPIEVPVVALEWARPQHTPPERHRAARAPLARPRHLRPAARLGVHARVGRPRRQPIEGGA